MLAFPSSFAPAASCGAECLPEMFWGRGCFRRRVSRRRVSRRAGLPAAGSTAAGFHRGGFHGGGSPGGGSPGGRVSRRRASTAAGFHRGGFHGGGLPGGGLPGGGLPRRRASRRRASRRRASTAAGFHGGGLPRRRASTAAALLASAGQGARRPPKPPSKCWTFYRFHIVSIVLFIPPILRLATASHVRRPQMCSRPKYPIKNTGGSAIRVMGISGFRVPGGSGFGLTGGWALGPPGLNGSGLWFFFRHVPSCRKGKKATVPCDAALPCRAKGAAGVRIRRCLLCGQRRFKVARRIMAGSREKVFCGAVCPSGNFPGAPGDVGTGFSPQGAEFFPAHRQLHALPTSLSPQETEIRAISQTKRAPSSQKPSAFIFIHPQQTRPVTSRASSLTFRGEHPAHAQAQLSALQIPSAVCAASAFGASPCCTPHRDDSPSSLDFFSTPG